MDVEMERLFWIIQGKSNGKSNGPFSGKAEGQCEKKEIWLPKQWLE